MGTTTRENAINKEIGRLQACCADLRADIEDMQDAHKQITEAISDLTHMKKTLMWILGVLSAVFVGVAVEFLRGLT